MASIPKIFLLLILFGFSHPLHALTVPPQPEGYVTDKAGLLSPGVRSQLESFLYNYERQTGTQVVVAAFPSLEEGSLEDFSIRLAEQWKIGQKGRDNGVILLIFKDDRKMRIETGYGIEAQLPDATAGQIIREVIAPYFQQGDFDRGVTAGVQAIVTNLQGEASGAPEGQSYRRERSPEDLQALQRKFSRILKAVGVIALILFFLDLLRYSRFKKGHRFYSKRYSFWEWWFRFGMLLFVLNLIFRVAFYAMLAGRGGSYGGRGGFGGFSGGGGGRFGGGGASGGW